MVVTVFRPRLHYKGARVQKLQRKQKFRQNSELFPAPARFFAARLTAPARGGDPVGGAERRRVVSHVRPPHAPGALLVVRGAGQRGHGRAAAALPRVGRADAPAVLRARHTAVVLHAARAVRAADRRAQKVSGKQQRRPREGTPLLRFWMHYAMPVTL